jgi:uncharacterized protein YdhG (YjbR/CyaY superfamily)
MTQTTKRPKSKTETIDDYLAGLGDEPRAALQKLRKAIRSAAPGAEECISYGIPAFRLDGRLIAGFSASKGHCSYFPMSGSVVATLRDDLARYETSKGTIRFATDEPLPTALVRKLVKARIAESE